MIGISVDSINIAENKTVKTDIESIKLTKLFM